jgi:hypothetical protein
MEADAQQPLKQQELEQQRAAQRGNEGREHDHTGGRERWFSDRQIPC